MRVPTWMAALKLGAPAPNAVDDRKLFEMTVIDGHSGSGLIRFRRTLLAHSYVEALTLALEGWEPKPSEMQSGVSIQVGQGWVQSGGYRDSDGRVALVERQDGPHRIVLTEFEGTETTFLSDADAWTYLQDHHYQPVR